MKALWRRALRLGRQSRYLLVAATGLLLAAPAFAQGTGNSPWENAVNVLETAFTSTIARGLTVAYDGFNPMPPMFCYLKPYFNDPNKSYFRQVADGEL